MGRQATTEALAQEDVRAAAPPVTEAGVATIAFYRRPLKRWKLYTVIAVILASCVAYGIAFAMFAPAQMIPLLAPLPILTALVIWALPDGEYAPTWALEPLYLAFFAALFLWPNYIALVLPGLPWITALRSAAIPMTVVLLLSVSVSAAFRQKLSEVLQSGVWIWRLLIAFVAIQTFSLALSSDKGFSVSRYLVAQTNWTAIVFVGCYVFSRRGFAELWAKLLLAMVAVICFLGIWEGRIGHVPWAGHIPSFLHIDPGTLKILSGSSRASSGIYRVQTIYSTALGCAEFLGLAAPFAVHVALSSYNVFLRIFAAILLPVIVFTIVLTDSRLGVVACMLSVLFYVLIWSALRWREKKKSLLAPAIVMAYPAIFCGFIISTFLVGRLRAMVWGSGAQTASTESRHTQWMEGMPKVLSHPFGHGVSEAAKVLGFYNGPTLTIDSYYLSMLLDYGFLGFLVYYGIFITTITLAVRRLLAGNLSSELRLLLPIAVSLVNFVVIKSVFSQEDNHPFAFMMVGAVLALAHRAKQEAAARSPAR